MPPRKRLNQQESRLAALEAARILLLEEGPQAITLKSVAAKMGRTHANLLHHFGTAADLQKALATYLAQSICESTAEAVLASRAGGGGNPRQIVDLVFDAFGDQGGAALVSWMLLSGNADALEPVYDVMRDVIARPEIVSTENLREAAVSLVLLAIGDALVGSAMVSSFDVKRSAAREAGERLLIDARDKAKAEKADQPT